MSSPLETVRRRLAAGPLPFAEVMSEALYGEGGYYRGEQPPIGPDGDFVTGSSLSPLFGRTTAQLVRRLDELLGRPADILEVGYGSGAHLRHLLADLGDDRGRRIVAVDRVARPVPKGVEVHSSLEELTPGGIVGLVFSYELFDALPVHRLRVRRDGSLGELWVELGDDEELRYVEGDLSSPGLERLVGEQIESLEPGQIVDLAPGWGSLYGQLAGSLDRGLVVTCDYGFERRRLFDRRVRPHGTLACYRRQRVHRDALRWLGEQDLTAHVDFTTLIESGEAVGLTTVAFTRLARWLMACGLFEQLQGGDVRTRLAAMDLLAGDGMGEEIRVLVQAGGVDPEGLFDLDVLGGVSRSPGHLAG
jgi:SAM-dependent MidA family methyltransferase